jgi:hypothetical protein
MSEIALPGHVITVGGVKRFEVLGWFQEYLDTFAGAAHDYPDGLDQMLKFYGVPLVVCRDDGATVLATDEEVLSFARSLVEGLCLDGYSHSEPLEPEVIAVNNSTALYRSEFSRRHIDGSEIERMGATYFILQLSRVSAYSPWPSSIA